MNEADRVRAEIKGTVLKLRQLEAKLIELEPQTPIKRLHALCYKCAANKKLAATEYRITKHNDRLFSVDEMIDGCWKTLTRRNSLALATQALEDTKAYRQRREERAARLATR